MRVEIGSSARLQKHYRTNWTTVRRWIEEAGLPLLKSPPPNNARLIPEDFAEVCPTLSQAELGRRYKADRGVIVRWCNLLGVQPKPRGPAKPKPTLARYYRVPGQSNVTALRNYGPHDEAADVLRHHFPVYRCDDRGRQNEKGKFWRVGNAVVDGDELLVRAARYRRVAA